MTAKRVLLPLFFLTVLIQSCRQGAQDKKASSSKGPVSVDVSVAAFRSFSNPIEVSGNVLASEFIELRTELSGRVVGLYIPEGQTVAEGTLLVKLFDDDLRAQLRKYESQLAIASKTEARLKQLLAVNGLNQQEYDQALSQMQSLEADVELLKAQIRKTEIRAPFAGRVGLRRISNGAFVTPQDVLATLQQTAQLKVDFVLPELYADAVKNGDMVTVVSEGGKAHNARIMGIEPLVSTSTRNLMVRAVLAAESSSLLRPGSFVQVSIDIAKGKESILVPTNCIIPETRFKKIAVIRNGKVDMVQVETGYRGEEQVEILSGLEKGDTFAVSAILYLKPGAEVKIKSVKP